MSTLKVRIVWMGDKYYPQKRVWFRWKYFLKWSGPEIYGYSSESDARGFLRDLFQGKTMVVQQHTVHL